METLYVFFLRFDVIIYIVCAFGLFWYLNEFLRARRILRRAVFDLESELGRRMQTNAALIILVLGSLLAFTIHVNANIAPTLPPELLNPPTPTPNIFSTRLASPTPLGTAEVRIVPTTLPLVATITLPGQVAETPETAVSTPGTDTPATSTPDGPTATPEIGCTIQLNFTEPRDGGFVSGTISFTGTAATNDFQYYTLEANGPQTDGEWASLLGRTIDQPVIDSFLGSANLSQWESGPYLIRLTAVDSSGSPSNQCVIQVTLNNS